MDSVLALLDKSSDIIFGLTLSVLPIVFLYEGAKRWSFSGNWKNAKAWLAWGFITLTIGVLMNAAAFHVIQKALPIVTTQKIPTIDQNWGRNFSPEEREEVSRFIAISAARELYQVRNYVDITGKWKSYCATSEDLSEIAELSAAKANLMQSENMNKRNLYTLPLTGLASLFIGWLVGFESRNKIQKS